MSELVSMALGMNGQIEVYEDRVIIKRKGFSAFISQGLKGDKNIPMSSINSVQFKEANWLTNGYLQLGLTGGSEAKGGIVEAVNDENTVLFRKKSMIFFNTVRMDIEKRMGKVIVAQSQGSFADELSKLADLLDRGILTEEEFAGKKKELLGL
jgi:hypothetical protein